MKLTWYGQSAFSVEFKDTKILIDPFFTGNPVLPEGISVKEVAEGVSHVMVTHGHDDHVGDSIDILKSTGAQFTSNYEICQWAQSKGIENINPMGCGGTVDLGAFKVSLTIAHHTSTIFEEGVGLIPLGNPNGIIIDAPNEPVLYHMGDTGIFQDMALINEIYQPKVGIVPIGDRFTMGAKTAALACKRYFLFDTIIPCHYGTFPIIDPDNSKFLKEMGTDADKVWRGGPGDSFSS